MAGYSGRMNSVKLMYSDKIIADTVEKDGVPCLQLRKGLLPEQIPFGLFMNSEYETLFKIHDWACKRCFPPERFGADELLKELGLDKYDRWEIVKRTGAEMTGVDKFWIDFGQQIK